LIAASSQSRFFDGGSTPDPSTFADIPAMAKNDKIRIVIRCLTDSTNWNTYSATIAAEELK